MFYKSSGNFETLNRFSSKIAGRSTKRFSVLRTAREALCCITFRGKVIAIFKRLFFSIIILLFFWSPLTLVALLSSDFLIWPYFEKFFAFKSKAKESSQNSIWKL